MKINRLFHSFGHAITGFRFALRKEQNFKIEVLAGILVIGAMFLVGVKTWEAIVLVIMIAGVLFGVVGLIVAIPVYTSIKVILKEFLSDNEIVQKLTKNI